MFGRLCVCVFVCVSKCLLVYLFVCVSVSMSACVCSFVCICFFVFVCVSDFQFVCVCVCLFVCVSVSVCLSYLLVCVSTHQFCDQLAVSRCDQDKDTEHNNMNTQGVEGIGKNNSII